ncbi:unnamed protein product [Coregonus sp. 'balchen']|nr:unnamed protein product [Coregonus sp. 'balchen']
MEVDETLVSYDPTKDFILQKPSPEHQGVFYCKAVTKAIPQISTKYQLFYVEMPSGPSYVTIEASLSSSRGGDNINITCTVLGEPEMDVSFTWTYPGQLVRHTTRIFQSVMAVDDLETIDFGRYICRAKKKHGEIAVATSVHSNKLDSKREHLEPV